MQRRQVATVEQLQDLIVPLNDLGPLPMPFWVARLRCRVVRHVDAEPGQQVRAQGGAAAMHAKHDDKRRRLGLGRAVGARCGRLRHSTAIRRSACRHHKRFVTSV
jgi:hypothetical protein